MYEMATGRGPFQADNPAAMLYMHVHEVPAPAIGVNPSLSMALSDLIARALEKDPEKRFGSAEEMMSDLENLADTEADVLSSAGEGAPAGAGATRRLQEITGTPEAKSARGRPSAQVIGLAGLVLMGMIVLALVGQFRPKAAPPGLPPGSGLELGFIRPP